MMKWLIRNRLASFERKFNYDMSYARDIMAADVKAFLTLARLQGMSEYRRDVPRDVYWAAKLVGTVSEDCGPCTQLAVSMGIADGADPRVLASVLEGEAAVLSADVRLGVKFARAAIGHHIDADELRDAVVARWGARALVSLAFAITTARMYPTLKYALGHGKACQRVVVAGEPIAVVRERVAASEVTA